MKKVKTIELVEKRRSLFNKKREYFVHVNGEETNTFDITEKSNFFKSFLRIMQQGKDAMAKFNLSILDASGTEIYKIKKSVGPFEMAPFKLCDTSGNPIFICSDRIKFGDDSFIEITNKSKDILYKSGLGDRRKWFPVYIFDSNSAETSVQGIQGNPVATITREKSGGIGRLHSGNIYKLSLADEIDDQEKIAMLINFMVAIDFGYDNRN